MGTYTDRLTLPLLSAGQAQKEVTHNEALALADILLMPIVQSIAPASPPAAPALGQCWVVGNAATGAWAGHDGAIAGWTAGGWRFAAAQEGMQVWSIADGVLARRANSNWLIGAQTAKSYGIGGVQIIGAQQAAIATPSGGIVLDTQARSAISSILAVMRAHGLISA